MTTETNNKQFYQTLIKIAIPIFFSQLMGSLLGILDTFMVTELGDNTLSAVGIGSQFLSKYFRKLLLQDDCLNGR